MTQDKSTYSWMYFLLGIALLLAVGLAIMFLAFSSSSAPTPAPAPTVTETDTEYIEVVPPACTEAIDAATDIAQVSSKSLRISARIVAAATNNDDTALQAQTTEAIQNARAMDVPLINFKRTSLQCLKEAQK